MTLPHFTAETPMFMPVGTQGEASCLIIASLADSEDGFHIGVPAVPGLPMRPQPCEWLHAPALRLA